MAFPAALQVAADFRYDSPYGEQVPPGVQPGDLLKQLRDAIIILQGEVGITGSSKNQKTAKTVWFNLDNGAGTTVDDVVLLLPYAVTIRAARIVYADVTSGTVAAGNAKLGITVGGAEVVAATAYENAKAVGTKTELTVITAASANVLAANVPLICRHTGVAATALGNAFVEVEYTVN